MSCSRQIDWASLHKRYPFSAGEVALPEGYRRVAYLSRADGTDQGAFFYKPDKPQGATPLLVILHPWSSDTDSHHLACVRWCVDRGWAAIAPDFRGANFKPSACGSELVVADILSAVEWARGQAPIDGRRICLVGTSGGGHAALLMAGRAPRVWAGVSAWVPVTDLAAWHRQHASAGKPPGDYLAAVEKCCGGPPGASAAVDEEYRRRSPLAWLAAAKGLAVDINAGIRDGHEGSVPISHALCAFNALAAPEDRIDAADIRHMTENAEVPPRLRVALDDPSYGARKPLFRRTSGRARVTIFDGGHELVPIAAMAWLERQRKG